jgi:uncharacterized membrane protein
VTYGSRVSPGRFLRCFPRHCVTSSLRHRIDIIATAAENTAMEANIPQTSVSPPSEGMVTLAHVLYGLHGFSALMGMLGPMLIVTTFLTGWPSIVAVIINYVKRGDVRGTYLDSHFSWQLRTFWYALLWVAIALLLIFTVIGIPFAWVLVLVLGLWVLYRIIRGWIALVDGRPMPQNKG